MIESKHFGALGLKGLEKIGDIVVPGDGVLPSFSTSGAVRNVDRMADYMHPADRDPLAILLPVLGVLPKFLLRAIVAVAVRHRRLPMPLSMPARLLDVGLRGFVCTLYYSDVSNGNVHEAIGWDARVGTDALPTGSAATVSAVAAEPEGLVDAGSSPAVRSVALARSSAPSLAALSLEERARLLTELRLVIARRRDEIISRIQDETGKSKSDALISELYGVLENLAWLESKGVKALRDRKQHTPIALMGKTSWTWFEPLGTVLIISPWNYPFYQAIVPIASAFLAGNTVVFKPSEWTPLKGLVEELLEQAGFAPGWVQVVYGAGDVGEELVTLKPDKVFFTGSTRTGKKILAAAAEHLTPVELELGGKDAMIVFADADVDRAASGAVWGAMTNTGQSCTSVERLYVERPIYEAFVRRAAAVARDLKQEIDSDGDADIGAMTTDFQVAIIARQVQDALAKGARFLTGAEWDRSSRMIPPMVVDNIREDMELINYESFGPFLPVIVFDDEEEVLRMANDTPYGLTGSVWSANLDRARRVARRLQAGGVSINNVMLTEGNPALPFGGIKDSGFGRHKGEYGLHGYCNVKSVIVDKNSKKIEANWFPYTRTKYELFDRMTAALFGGRSTSWPDFAKNGMKLEKYADQAGKKGRKGDL